MVTSNGLPWVVFRLQSEYFALPIDSLKEMVILDQVVTLPGAPAYVRGIMTLRGRAIPVVDLRLRLGMPSTEADQEGLIEMLTVREQDHRNWLAELEASVRDKRAFKLATDPHKCAFGRWYDAFQTEDNSLRSVLRRFDGPHKTIHGIASTVTELASKQAFDEAFGLIERTRKLELAAMVKLFDTTRQMIRETKREVGLIMDLHGRFHALAVDAVDGVEPLRLDEDTNGVLDMDLERLMACIARRPREDQVVIVLRPDELVAGDCALPA